MNRNSSQPVARPLRMRLMSVILILSLFGYLLAWLTFRENGWLDSLTLQQPIDSDQTTSADVYFEYLTQRFGGYNMINVDTDTRRLTFTVFEDAIEDDFYEVMIFALQSTMVGSEWKQDAPIFSADSVSTVWLSHESGMRLTFSCDTKANVFSLQVFSHDHQRP